MSFFQEYKRLDNLCKDLFNCNKGISTYIEHMEKYNFNAQKIQNWDSNLQKLKKYRHIRNLIAHENNSDESDYCNKSDEKWIVDFYDSIIKRNDPLALYKKSLRTRNKTSHASKRTNSNNTNINTTLKRTHGHNNNTNTNSIFFIIGVIIMIIILLYSFL